MARFSWQAPREQEQRFAEVLMGKLVVWRRVGTGSALWVLALVQPVVALQGQTPSPTQGQPQEGALRVFLDCPRCDFDYFRQEVPFVSWVRDRMDAELHVLVTLQPTGAGGVEYTFHFLGQGRWATRRDTLVYVSLPDETADEIRAGLVRVFKLGVVPFAAATPVGRLLDVRYQAPRQARRPEEVADRWNLWVFETRVSADVSGESRTSERSFEGSVGANRTTEAFKIDLSLRGSYDQRKFELSSGRKITSTAQNHALQGTAVWSLGPHWSFGLNGSATRSTRLNQDLALRVGPALEYNIYPYAEATRRQLTFFYTLEAAHFDYEELTLFDKTQEERLQQSFELSAAYEQPWGEIDASVEWTNFLDRFSQHRLDVFGRFEIRLFRGLSLDLEASAARVKNQIYVPREDIPDEDVLLERRQLGTDFEYSFEVGFSYRFGSIFNNVVNPRMRRGRGGGGWWG